MTTQVQIKALVARIESAYEQCLALLQSLKTGVHTQFFSEEFFGFQPTLCTALMELDSAYREIERLKKTIAHRKTRLSASWFRTRMATLAHYQEVLLDSIKIGKFLGDSFAWFFYQKERGYLNEHLKQERQRHLPPGIGGLGEKEFVKNTRGIWGKLLIYHGTTTILRIGDVSLIDLKTFKLAALGELKTYDVGPNQIKVRVEFIGPRESLPDVPEVVGTETPRKNLDIALSQPQRDRLRRQVKRIQETISKEHNQKPGADISLATTTHAGQLNRLVSSTKRGQFSYVQAGDGLVLGGYRSLASSLFGRIDTQRTMDWSRRLGDFGSHIKPIMRKGADDNSIYLSGLFYPDNHGPHFIHGSVPLFWWPVNSNSLRAIIFQEVLVFSVYNPAHLFAKLRSSGFEIVKAGPKEFSLRKRFGEAVFTLERFSYFMHLIQYNLLSEDYIIDLVKAAEEQSVRTLKESGARSARIDLVVSQQIHPMPKGSGGKVDV